jgi:hypothetical protein
MIGTFASANHAQTLKANTALHDFILGSADYSFVVSLENAWGLLAPGPVPDAAIASLTDEAFNSFTDQVPQEVDVTNFLLDLREMGSLIPSLAENMAKTVSGGFLAYSFGWKPFMSDLKSLGGLTQSVADRLRYLRETYGKVTRLGYTGTWSIGSRDFVYPNNPYYSFKVRKSTQRFVAGCYLFHLLERLEGIEGQIRAFSSALGLLNPSAVVWERIPYSFVADWFVRTDGIVNSLKLQPFAGLWNLRDISHSFLQEIEWEMYVQNNDYVELDSPQLVAVISTRTYVRNPGLPVSASILSTPGLTTGQLALAAALIGAASK